MATRANVVNINEDIILIDDAGDSTCYLVMGDKKALLIDTANGRENLREIIGGLTNLPVTVVNTHGHLDHIYGNVYFEEALMHPADFKLHDEHFRLPEAEELKRVGLSPCRLVSLEEDAVFDLGGIDLAVVPVPGHTAGSVALLCRKHRILFTGDAVNGHLWMQLAESRPLKVLKESLEKLQNTYRTDFDHILTGHGKGLEDASVADELLEGVNSLLRGECDNDHPYTWFAQTDMAHPFGGNKENLIAYNQVRLDIERGLRKPYPSIRHVASNPAMDGLVDIRLDIVYSRASGQELKLALVTPWGIGEKEEPMPLMVFVQGSGFQFPNIGYELAQMAYYARNGIVVATVTHRNCLEKNPFPAYLQDVKTAIRFLRHNQKDFNIDGSRLGIFGTSSGGNTAMLAGLTGDASRFRTDEYPEESDAVSLVVECFGPTYMEPLLEYVAADPDPEGNIFHALAGKQDLKKLLHDISPVNYVEDGKPYPPFLLLHGDKDTVVPYHQMLTMFHRLYDAGVDVQAVCVDDAPHEGSFWSWEVHGIILDFIKDKL